MFIKTDLISVTDRQRTEMAQSKLDELEISILRHGLLHPIVITEDFKLVAGGRRLQAIKNLHAAGKILYHGNNIITVNHIPYTITEGDDLRLKEIELDENLMREELSWQDRVRALSQIHALRKLNNPAQTYVQTAKEIIEKTGATRATKGVELEVSRAMITAEMLDDPEVKNAGSEKLAFNAAIRKIRNAFATELAGRVTDTRVHRAMHGDARQLLQAGAKNIEDGSIRCFILDPPYGISADRFGNAADGRHSYQDDSESAKELNIELIKACTPLAAKDAHMWVFCDIDMFHDIASQLDVLGWNVFRTPLIWNSGTSGHVPSQRIAIRRNYELLLFATRREANRGLAQLLDDVIRITARATDEDHGAQKPVELYELLLRLSTVAGDTVLDPTCGSGTIFRASDRVKVNAIGVELDENHYRTCLGTIAELGMRKEGEDEKD